MADVPSLNETIQHDPQMAIPEYPRLQRDMVKIWDTETKLIIFGGPSPVIFSGKASATIMPGLMILMDGSRSVSQICKELPHVPASYVQRAVAMMYMKGLVEDGAALAAMESETERKFSTQLEYYSRYLDYTRTFANRIDVLEKLQKSTVLMITDSPIAVEVARQLDGFGLGVMEICTEPALVKDFDKEFEYGLQTSFSTASPDEFLSRASVGQFDEYSLVIALMVDHDTNRFTRLNALATNSATIFAYGIFNDRQIQLGPVVEHPHSPCFECVDIETVLQKYTQSTSFSQVELDYAASHFALNYLTLLTRFSPIMNMDAVQNFDGDSLLFIKTPSYKQPACPACGESPKLLQPGEGGLQKEVVTGEKSGQLHSISWFYHENSNFKTYHLVQKGHQAHYDIKNRTAVDGALKKYSNAAQVALPVCDELPSSMHGVFGSSGVNDDLPGHVSAEHVAVLLSLAAGRKVQKTEDDLGIGFRVTPSAGALASQNVYLINSDVDNLPLGLSYFSPDGHLEWLKTELPDYSGIMLTGNGSEAASDAGKAVLVITETLARVESKYASICYRYTLSDSGAMLGSLHAIAQALEMKFRHTFNFYDDALSGYLGCSSATEYPAVMIVLG